MQINNARLPLGKSSFTDIIANNQIYVDKTDLIASFASTGSFYFLSRPRRFGKSTLVDTLQDLFTNGLINFKNLKIAKKDLWHDKTYKVLHLDFSDITANVDFFNDFFVNEIDNKCKNLNLKKDTTNRLAKTVPSECLKSYLVLLKDEKIVLLIDEYDAPLTANLDNKEAFNKIRESLSDFYKTIKAHSKKFRFLFITGITRYSQASIFSALNNLEDLSFDPKYGTLVGYTKEELEYYFKDYIENAALVLNEKYQSTSYNYDVIVKKLEEHYDGYSFDSEALTHVYNPWSILNFLKKPYLGFANYWLTTGAATPTLLIKYLNSKDSTNNTEVLNNYVNLDFTTLSSESDLSPAIVDISDEKFSFFAVLYQAGYLTIKSIGLTGFNIGIPNLEVKQAFANIILKSVTKKDLNAITKLYVNVLVEALETKDWDKLKDVLNKYFNEYSYDFYKNASEATYRELIKVLLTILALSIRTESEVETSKGRCGLRISYKDKLYVIEFKLARKDTEINEKLNEAIVQIKDRKYDNLLRDQTIVPLAIVILDTKAENENTAIHEIALIKEI